MADERTVQKPPKAVKRAMPKTRYFIGKGVEITEEQAREHVKRQNERAKK